MGNNHHSALLVGYGAAMIGWLVAAQVLPRLWPRREPPRFRHPWFEIGWVLLAVLAVLGLGQLYVYGYLLPSTGGLAGKLLDACNQLVIFSPLLLLLRVRGHPLRTAWLPLDRVWLRILVGLALAQLSILAFTLVRQGSDPWLAVATRVYDADNVSHLVQVLLEDIAIAILFVRFRAAIGSAKTIVLVAVLFAAGHIPSLLATGVSIAELATLAADAGLAIGVLCVLQRSADIWWLWCVHFAMDMMQFYAVPG